MNSRQTASQHRMKETEVLKSRKQDTNEKKQNNNHQFESQDSSQMSNSDESGDDLDIEDGDDDDRSDMRPSIANFDPSRLTNNKDRSAPRATGTREMPSNMNTGHKSYYTNSNIKSPDLKQNEKEKLKKQLSQNQNQDRAKLIRKRNQHLSSIGYNGHVNFILRKDKHFQVPEEQFDVLKSIEDFEPDYRDYVVTTVLYLVQPTSKKMLSEDLVEIQLGGEQQQQDITTTVRKKFFEWSEGIAIAKIFPNDSKEQDTLLIELLSTKLSKSQARHILSPLLVISTKFVIHMQFIFYQFKTQLRDDAELSRGIEAVIPMLLQINEKYDFDSLKAYDQQNTNDVISEFMPKIMFYSTSKKLLKQSQDQKLHDILDKTLLSIQENDELKSQFLVMFKNRELFIEGNKDNGDIKSQLSTQNFPKEFLGRKVKTTPDVVLSFIKNSLNSKDCISLGEELNLVFMMKIEQLYESASKDFKKHVQNIKGFPRDVEELTTYLLDLKNEAIHRIGLCKQFALSATISSKIDEKRRNFENSMFQSALRQCLEHNEKQSQKKTQSLLKQLFEPMSKEAQSSKGYSLQNIQQMEFDLQNILTTYCETQAVGPSQTATLLDFLDLNLVDLYKNVIQREIDTNFQKQRDEDKVIVELEQQVQDLEKVVAEKKKVVQKNRDLIDEFKGKELSQKREVEHMNERQQEQEEELQLRRLEIQDLKQKEFELEESKYQMEVELKKKRDARIQKLKEQEELEKQKRDIKRSNPDDSDDEGKPKNKNCACKCQIF
ncbi:UNKNOWN [Stylonychia lemnae]|uniref:Uncharacterized protein n=1 Tax=Stylonychia lemnae TaxID=5949 RepID=A0A078A2M9_STYLE|nr:UNKNOWN [Stylonychia lemnae]|eukprot:CDW76345.1 UNKNOWN [Stylonychia lemnae]